MGNYQQRAELLWRSDSGGVAPNITANGTSPNLDIRAYSDLALYVTIGGSPTGTGPTLVVGVDLADPTDTFVLPQAVKTATLNASGTVAVYGGLHGLSPNQLVLPILARVSWTIAGTASPTFPGVQISLWGR
jgi:hypothetical protein